MQDDSRALQVSVPLLSGDGAVTHDSPAGYGQYGGGCGSDACHRTAAASHQPRRLQHPHQLHLRGHDIEREPYGKEDW